MKIILQKSTALLFVIGCFTLFSSAPVFAQSSDWIDLGTSGSGYGDYGGYSGYSGYSDYSGYNVNSYGDTSLGNSYSNPSTQYGVTNCVDCGGTSYSSNYIAPTVDTSAYSYGSNYTPSVDTSAYSYGSNYIAPTVDTSAYSYGSNYTPYVDTTGYNYGSNYNSGYTSGYSYGSTYMPSLSVGIGFGGASYGYGSTAYPSYTYSSTAYPTTVYPTTVYPSTSVNTQTQQVINTINCPSGSVLTNGQCVNNVNGTVVTNINCPNGTTLSNGQCIATVNGNVITNTNCPSGTVLTNGQCVNNINGNVITNTNCPSGTTYNGSSCVSTYTPPVITNTNCPANTYYSNGACQQIVNSSVISYQTCWDGSVISTNSLCAQQYKMCPNGTNIPVNQTCYSSYSTPYVPQYVAPQVIKFNNVVTSVVTQITNTSGRCNGIGLIASGAPSTGWFEYGETANLGRTTASAQIGTADTAPFSNVLASLRPSTKYFCRAVMQNQYGTVKGEIVSFVTKSSAVSYVKPIATPVKKTTKTVAKKNTVVCVDGTYVQVKNEASAALINQGEKLLSVSIDRVDGHLTAGENVQYRINYKNLVDTRLSGVLVKITLPQEITFVSSNAGNYDADSRTLVLNQDSIDPYTEGTVVVTGTVTSDASLGKTIVVNVYAAYTVPGTHTQDEVTAYSVGSITASIDSTNKDTGAKKVVGLGEGKSFLPSTLIEWLALIAIFFIIFILGRSIYMSYKEEEVAHH